MEPFPVICETCRARLKVRSESAIGEIHGCPKCGSMVHIVPPLEWNKGGPTSPAAEATSPSAVVAAPSVPAATSAETALPSFDVATVNVPAESAAVEAAASVAPTVWSPLLLAGVIGASMFVGGAITLAIWPSTNTAAVEPAPPAATPPPAVNSESAPNAEASEQDEVARADNQPVKEPTPAPALPDGDDVADAPAPATATSSTDEPAVTGAMDAALPKTPSADEDSPIDVDEVADVPPVDVPKEGAPQAERDPVLRFDPLDFDPSQLSLATSSSSSVSSSTASVPDDASDDTGGFEESETDAETAKSDAPPPQAETPSVTVRVGPVVVAAGQPHKVAHRLALPLDSLEVSDMPLARFLEMLSDLAGVPITLDPVTLQLVGASPRAPVSATVSGVTLEELLRDTLANHRLEFSEQAGQVLVVLPKADRKLAGDYPLPDLVAAGEDDAAVVARTIETFVAPSAWQAGGGADTIEVDGSKVRLDAAKRVHHELLIFCERLRLARGLPQKTRYPSDRLHVESPYAKLEAKLSAETTFTMLPWTRLADVVRHWQESAGVTILVDWRALADVQYSPSTPISCSAIDRRWDEALDEILQPLDLGWYAVDGETIAITSRVVLDNLERVEFHTVPQALRDEFADDEALVEALRDELLEDANVMRPAAAIVRMEFDGPSGRLIVRGTPAVHRYLTQRLADSQ